MKRFLLGTIFVAVVIGIAGTARADCTVMIATTPTGSTFPCTVCLEGGRPVSLVCTPPVVGK